MLYVLTCIYISMYYIRPTEWVPGFIGLPLVNVLGIICVLTIIFQSLAGEVNILKGPVERMMAGLLCSILLSHLCHFYFQGIIDSFETFLPTVVGFYIVIFSINTRNRYNWFVLLLIALITFLGYEGWLEHTTGFSHGGQTPILDNKVLRIRWHGVFNDPNDLGLAYVMAVPFLVNMFFTRRFLLPLLCLPLIISSIYYTDSRGTYLALVSSIAVYFIIKHRSKKGVLFALILAGVLMTVGPSRMEELSASESSANGRLDSWYAGFQMFMTSPFFGVGKGMFTDYHPLTAHNSYVLVMSELGFFGLYCFMGLMYYPINWVRRNVFQNQASNLSPEDIGMLSAVFGSLIGLMVSMFFLSRSYILIPYILIALAVSCIKVIGLDGKTCSLELDEPPEVAKKNIAKITLGLIAFIYIMTKLLI